MKGEREWAGDCRVCGEALEPDLFEPHGPDPSACGECRDDNVSHDTHLHHGRHNGPVRELAIDILDALIPLEPDVFGPNCTRHHTRYAVALEIERKGPDVARCLECLVAYVVGRTQEALPWDVASNLAYARGEERNG